MEDYLKAIYALEELTDLPATTSDIAERLDIAPPSVSGMLRRLATRKLIRHERYRGVSLTPAGRKAALKTLRRHRVIEAYLASVLGFSWDTVHAEAERLEHAASDELIDRMAAALGDPATDPHGAPIPTRDGTLVIVPTQLLAEQAVGTSARVASVGDEDGELLRYVGSLAIRPGAVVKVVSRAPFDGPLTLEVSGSGAKAGRTHVVGSTVARAVKVDKPR
ncbi:MAG: metal-dependent transcriptional regulator [Gemmatimonadetes bacterium]|nr:metal-dependent transcriptional regulator [Gemmatimonadota bacterium]